MQSLVTVVVPIYNVEKYLDRCINSIVNQTYENLEILLIDDGSPDRCPEMCDEWAKMDGRIRVVHKKNAGLGMARNTGIENATGEYICFFDSDDYVALNAVERAYSRIENENADIAIFGMNKVDSEGCVIGSMIPNSPKDVYTGREVQDILLPRILSRDPVTGESYNLPSSAWSILISRELVERTNWRFASEREIISEDIYALLSVYADIRTAVILREALYFYCFNSSSLTHTYRSDRYEKNKYFYLRCIGLCKEKGYSMEVEHSCAAPFMGNVFAALKQGALTTKNIFKARKRIKSILDDEVLQNVLKVKKNDNEPLAIRIFFSFMRHKAYLGCIALLWAQNRLKKEY